jgi:hypothetical protein
MSALGHSPTSQRGKAMSALPLKADIKRCNQDVSEGPLADPTSVQMRRIHYDRDKGDADDNADNNASMVVHNNDPPEAAN